MPIELDEKDEAGKAKKTAKLLIKITFTALALYLIITNADIQEIEQYIKSIELAYMIFALLILNLGQITSSFRTRYYFATEEYYFRKTYSVALYYIGMFFNRLLPGGVGGDGYMAYLLKKYHKIKILTSVRLLISSRANGLLFLMVFAFIIGFFSDLRDKIPYWYLHMSAGIIITILCYTNLTRLILKEKTRTQIGASKYSLIIQSTVMAASTSLLIGAGAQAELVDYLMLFMVSTVATMIPISFGGAGMREISYFYLAPLIGLDAELGIAISLVYFLLDTFSSLAGLYFWYRIESIKAFKRT